MEHPKLGKLDIDKNLATGHLSLDDRAISLRIDPDDKTLEEAISLAVVVAASLADFDQLSKDVIVRDLLESYNSGWNEYDEVQEDGSLKSVINPQLASKEFKDRLVLRSVNICSDSCVALWYNDGGMFWGHSVFVESLDGADFTRARAQLFG